MKRPPPPLHLIRSFEAAARHLSFTRAAEELGYTQAAISTHIRALEKHVGRQLFIRRARSLVLTEIGEAFLPSLRQALDQIDRATEAVVVGARQPSVTLACPVSLAENWLPEQLAAFVKVNPNIEVLVHATVWEAPGDDMSDISITIAREGEEPGGSAPLWAETLSVFVSPDIAETVEQPDDLLTVPHISVAGRADAWTLVGAALGLDTQKAMTNLRTNSTNVALELATSGAGAVVAPTSLGEVYVRRGLLMTPIAAHTPSPWGYYLSALPGSAGPATRLLHAFLRSNATSGEPEPHKRPRATSSASSPSAPVK